MEAWESQKSSAFQLFRDRKYDSAIAAYEKAVDAAGKIAPEGIEVAATMNDMATVYRVKNDKKKAEELYGKSAAMFEKLAASDPKDTEVMSAYRDALEGLAKIKKNGDKLEQAEQLYEKAIDVAAKANSPTKQRELVTEYKSVLQQLGKSEQVEQVSQHFRHLADAEQVPDHESHVREESQKYFREGDAAMKKGEVAKAESAYHQGFDFAMQSADPHVKGKAELKTSLFFFGQKKFAAAETMILQGIRDLRAAKASDNEMRECLVTLGTIQHELGKSAASEKAMRLSLKLAESVCDPDSMEVAGSLSGVVQALADQRKYAEGLPYFERCYAIVRKHGEVDKSPVVMQACWLANLYYLAGKQDKCAKLVESYSDEVVKHGGDLNLVGRLFVDYGNECKRISHKDEAALFYNAALKVLKHAPDGASELKRAAAQLKALQTPAST